MWQQKTEDTYEAPTEPPKIDRRNWVKTMEAMDKWLHLIPGEHHLLLAYVIQKDIALSEDEDLAESYPSITNEMVHHAPIGTMNPPYIPCQQLPLFRQVGCVGP